MKFGEFFKPKTHVAIAPCMLCISYSYYYCLFVCMYVFVINCYSIFFLSFENANDTAGALPMLGQVTSAARGATDVFSGLGRHVNHSVTNLPFPFLFLVSYIYYYY